MLFIHTKFCCNACLRFPMFKLSMYRNCIFWMQQRVDQLDFFLTCMSGYMSILENNICALTIQIIDNLGNCFLISRNWIRAEYNQIVWLDFYFAMNAICHTGQRSQWFSLTSGSDQDCLFIRIVFQLIHFNQCIIRDIQITKFRCNGNNIDHAAAFYHYFTAKFVGCIDNLLYTVYIGSKGCHNNSLMCMIAENTLKCLANFPLCHSKARTFRIGTVAHQCQNSFFTNLTKTLQINGISVNRCIIHFKITGMHDGSCRRVNCQCSSVLNTVICLDKFHTEASKIDMLSVFNYFALYFI